MGKWSKSYCSRECAFKNKVKEKSNVWKGDRASYSAIHKWGTKYFGKPCLCAECGTKGKRMNWANISRTYSRDRSDWIELCAKCHKFLDTRKSEDRAVLIEKYTGKKAQLDG